MKYRDKKTSKYYGIRLDVRNGVSFYRCSLSVDNKVLYLGVYREEKEAAYAFNVAFDLFKNGFHEIKNTVSLSKEDSISVRNNVHRLLVSKKLIKFLP